MDKKELFLRWELVLRLSGDEWYSRIYRAKYKDCGVQMEIHIPVLEEYIGGKYKFGERKISFFIDGVDQEFDTEEKILEVLNNTKSTSLKV